MEFYVPTLDSLEASENLEETIMTAEPNASVDIDLDRKKVIIESEASPETFKQLIVASGNKFD